VVSRCWIPKNYSLRNYFIPDTTSFSSYRNSIWDAVPFSNNEYGVSSATGFYVFNHAGEITYRYEAYHPADVGSKRIFYARNILALDRQENLIYVDETNLAHYDQKNKIFNEVSRTSSSLFPFYPPTRESGGGWIAHSQLNESEFIFIFHRKDSIVTTITIKQIKEVISALPFNTYKEL
jgi:hypothetical protein